MNSILRFILNRRTWVEWCGGAQDWQLGGGGSWGGVLGREEEEEGGSLGRFIISVADLRAKKYWPMKNKKPDIQT